MGKSIKHPLTRDGKQNPPCFYAMSYQEIAEELGLTREGVRQIEIRALGKLRKGLEDAGYTWDDFIDLMER